MREGKLWGFSCSRFCLVGDKYLMKRQKVDLLLGMNSILALPEDRLEVDFVGLDFCALRAVEAGGS